MIDMKYRNRRAAPITETQLNTVLVPYIFPSVRPWRIQMSRPSMLTSDTGAHFECFFVPMVSVPIHRGLAFLWGDVRIPYRIVYSLATWMPLIIFCDVFCITLFAYSIHAVTHIPVLHQFAKGFQKPAHPTYPSRVRILFVFFRLFPALFNTVSALIVFAISHQFVGAKLIKQFWGLAGHAGFHQTQKRKLHGELTFAGPQMECSQSSVSAAFLPRRARLHNHIIPPHQAIYEAI